MQLLLLQDRARCVGHGGDETGDGLIGIEQPEKMLSEIHELRLLEPILASAGSRQLFVLRKCKTGESSSVPDEPWTSRHS